MTFLGFFDKLLNRMNTSAVEIFNDAKPVEKIKKKLPFLFDLSELETSRAGKTGMEAGSKNRY